jgi:hypothetical protein
MYWYHGCQSYRQSLSLMAWQKRPICGQGHCVLFESSQVLPSSNRHLSTPPEKGKKISEWYKTAIKLAAERVQRSELSSRVFFQQEYQHSTPQRL